MIVPLPFSGRRMTGKGASGVGRNPYPVMALIAVELLGERRRRNRD